MTCSQICFRKLKSCQFVLEGIAHNVYLVSKFTVPLTGLRELAHVWPCRTAEWPCWVFTSCGHCCGRYCPHAPTPRELIVSPVKLTSALAAVADGNTGSPGADVSAVDRIRCAVHQLARGGGHTRASHHCIRPQLVHVLTHLLDGAHCSSWRPGEKVWRQHGSTAIPIYGCTFWSTWNKENFFFGFTWCLFFQTTSYYGKLKFSSSSAAYLSPEPDSTLVHLIGNFKLHLKYVVPSVLVTGDKYEVLLREVSRFKVHGTRKMMLLLDANVFAYPGVQTTWVCWGDWWFVLFFKTNSWSLNWTFVGLVDRYGWQRGQSRWVHGRSAERPGCVSVGGALRRCHLRAVSSAHQAQTCLWLCLIELLSRSQPQILLKTSGWKMWHCNGRYQLLVTKWQRWE